MERLFAIATTLLEEIGESFNYVGAAAAQTVAPLLESLSRTVGDRGVLFLAAAALVVTLLIFYHNMIVRRALERAQHQRARWNDRPEAQGLGDIREEIASLSREVTALQYHLRARPGDPQARDLNGAQTH